MYYLGVDVSKNKLDWAVLDQDRNVVLEKVTTNKIRVIETLFTKLTKKYGVEVNELFVCVENTGVYGEPLKVVCLNMGVNLWVENALKIKKASHDMRGKSDKKDALRIADYCLRYFDQFDPFQAPDQVIVTMRELAEVRTDLLTGLRAMETQIKEAKDYSPVKYQVLKNNFKSTIRAMKAQLKKVEKELKDLAKSDPQIHTNIELIQTVPGVGFHNALMLVVVTHNFTRFSSPKQLACYAGIAPFPNSSGKSVRRDRVSHYANKKVKQLLHMAALVTVRIDGELRNYYLRKVEEGKPKMLVLNSLRYKIIGRVFSVVNRQSPYTKEIPFFKENACLAS